MILEETTIIKSKAIFSDNKEHRLLLRKEWNNEKPSAMVIMINPNTADTVNAESWKSSIFVSMVMMS